MILLLCVILSQVGQFLAYDHCPGDFFSYAATGLLEQFSCNGTCIPVDQLCNLQCYKGRNSGNTFHLWDKQNCIREIQWFTCDSSSTTVSATVSEYSDSSSTTGSSRSECTPGTEGCQPLHVPCGGQCQGGGSYPNWWMCHNGVQCIEESIKCSGYGPFCIDGSDQSIQTCSIKPNNTECFRVHSSYPPSRSYQCHGDRPMQCVAPNKGIDCLDHSDTHQDKQTTGSNKGNTKESNKVTINLIKLLKHCKTRYGRAGLKCDNKCIGMAYWCNPTYISPSAKCDIQNVTVDAKDPGDICLDRDFWQGEGMECGDGGSRCTGTHPGQCYASYKQCIVKDGYDSCQDSSHRVCQGNKTYSQFGVTRRGQDVCEEDTMWKCGDKDKTCIDSKLLCDGYPQCPNGFDEDSSMCSCPWNLTESQGPDILKNRNVSAASVRCLDNRYPGLNISTCAVKCDSRVECINGPDEEGCEEDKIILQTTTICVCIFFVAASIIVVHCLAPRLKRKVTLDGLTTDHEMVSLQPLTRFDSTTRLIDLICNTEQGPQENERKREMKTIMNNLHKSKDFSQNIQIVSTWLQYHKDKAEIERRNQVLYDLEEDQHKGKGHVICMKNNMGTNTVTQAVFKGTIPGFMDKIITFIGRYNCCCVTHQGVFSLGRWFASNKAFGIIAAIMAMAFYYVDLVKDLGVVRIMFTLIKATNLTYSEFVLTFNGFLLVLMLFSVIMSILLTSIYLAANHPGVELQLFSVKKKSILMLVRLQTFILSFLVPTTLIYQLTRQKYLLNVMEQQLANTISNNEGRVDPLGILKLLDQKRKVTQLEFLAYFRQKIDLTLEVIIQTTISIVMILVVRSAAESLTETGLQALFAEGTFLLILAGVISFKKIVTSNLALTAAQKHGFLPFLGKCLKAISYLWASTLRMSSVALFFGLPLGIMDILVHTSSLTNYNLAARSLIYDVQVVDGHLNELRISDTYNVKHYTQLTGLRLGWYGIIFLIGVIIHIILVTLVKKFAFSDGFSQLPKMEKFLHILHTVAFPEASIDWDYGNTGTLETYRRQWDLFKWENVFMLTLHTLENILMAVPVVYICSNVVNYHETLPYTTKLEKGAYSTARTLRMVWPIVVLLSPVLQWLLLLAYNKWGHPWKIIFAKFGKEESSEELEMGDLMDEPEEEQEIPQPPPTSSGLLEEETSM